MAWTTYQIILAVSMVVTGSINTLSTKWADRQEAVGLHTFNIENKDKKRNFDHPFLQAVGMFLGELSCLFVFHIIRIYRNQVGRPLEIGAQNFNPLIFLPASLCDMLGTSIMYIGLNLTYASSFQMLRGAVIIFTGLLSVAFLGKTIKKHMWAGMLTVMVGLILVGLADIVFGDHKNVNTDTNGIIAGDLLIVMAQIIVAVQMVYEEKFITRHNVPPLQAVGWEGLFGFVILGLLLIPFYYIDVKAFSTADGYRLENVPDALEQMRNNHIIIIATVGNILSIAFFNFSGISVTKEISATTRMVLDSIRTLVIWVFTMAVGWQLFHGLQIVGFLLLIVGMCLYNEVIIMPLWRRWRNRNNVELEPENEDERSPLLKPGSSGIQNGFQDASQT